MKSSVKILTSIALCGGLLAGSAVNFPVHAVDTTKLLREFEKDTLFSIKDLQVKPNSYVLDSAVVDVTGDNIADSLTLIGTKEAKEDIYMENITLVMQDGKTLKFNQVSVGKDDSGYGPKMVTADIDKNGTEDVLVQMATGGSGGTSVYSLITFAGGKGAALIDQDVLNQGIEFDVAFADQFKAVITNKSTKEVTTVDISENKANYLEMGMYDAKGKLLEPVTGAFNGLGQLNVDYDLEGNVKLVGLQKIWGSYHADTLAFAKSTWKVENGKLVLEQTKVTPFDWDNDSIAPDYLPTQAFTEASLKTKENNYILDSKLADVTGDGVRDEIFLVGHKAEGKESLYVSEITLGIKDGKTKKLTLGTVGEINEGYDDAKLFIGHFNKDKNKDILVQIPNGGSGGLQTFSLLTFTDNKLSALADQEVLSRGFEYDVDFADNFKVNISNEKTGLKETMDISKSKAGYIEMNMYKGDGKLLEKVEGWADPVSMLTAVDIDKDGIYELEAIQGISGSFHADRLGIAKTVWSVKNNKLELVNETLELRKEK
ncbi:hypothetical protein [Brevibacillus daliensis]|uniref:hypothetical protein n=1 Tax=Brevibacillus daliensis TaxID=2892995 RepID=UPI001E623701|nr:hypothetical protein [Brevibacillus daliensis]